MNFLQAKREKASQDLLPFRQERSRLAEVRSVGFDQLADSRLVLVGPDADDGLGLLGAPVAVPAIVDRGKAQDEVGIVDWRATVEDGDNADTDGHEEGRDLS
jgi:hypothetical protein